MKRLITTLILSTCCFSLAACETTRAKGAVRPDLENPARLVCVDAERDARGAIIRPDRGEPYVIDWSAVETVEDARVEHRRYVERERERNLVVTLYVVEIEGKLTLCADNAQWWRDYWSGLPDPE